jgi:hypothetical protein
MSPERGHNHLIWIGPLITIAGCLTYFLIFARYPALRDFPWVNLPLVALGVVVSVVGLARALRGAGSSLGKILGSLGLATSLAFAALFGMYIFSWTYRIPGPTDVSLAIDTADVGPLLNHDGSEVRLSDFRGKKVVLTFYRGHW